MPKIEIEIKNKIARSPEDEIVCGNSDYEIHFSFDEEWSEYNVKTARFRYNGTKDDIVFEGNVCNAPIIKGASFCTVGVFAGNLHTTTPAVIVCKRGTLCDDGVPADPKPDVYAQIMELLNNITGMDDEVVERALADYLAKNPLQESDPTVPAWAKNPEKPKYTAQEVGALPSDTVIPTKPEDVNAAPKQMVVDIVNGWASHTPAQIFAHVQAGGEAITYGMVGAVHRIDIISETSVTFICDTILKTSVFRDSVIIAEDGKVTFQQSSYKPTVPTTLPNPNALTFTGAVEGSYDGSKPVSIEIPQGGGGGEWMKIAEITLEEPISKVIISNDIDGNPFELNELMIRGLAVSETEAQNGNILINGKPLIGDIPIASSNTYFTPFEISVTTSNGLFDAKCIISQRRKTTPTYNAEAIGYSNSSCFGNLPCLPAEKITNVGIECKQTSFKFGVNSTFIIYGR